jgi:Cu-Zn family superoxide dismutase
MRTQPIKLVLGSAALAAAVIVGGASARAAKPAKPVKVTINHIDAKGVGKPAGTITLKETKEGLELTTNLKGLPPGEHGFHLHEKGSCEPADNAGTITPGHAAGPHYDPDATKAHKGPGGGGHKGDLPKLEISPKGTAKGKHQVAGLTLADVAGRTLMIHEAGDNYSDTPKPLGGGGGRIACGVIPGEAKAAAPAAPAAPAAAPAAPAPAAPAAPATPPAK